MNTQLIFPIAVYVVFMFYSATLLFRTRLGAIKEGKVSFNYFKTFTGTHTLPERMVLVGRHYDNQFQLPILFFITCLLQMQMNMVSVFTVALAWLFVLSRFVQSWHILVSGNIRLRVLAFAIGWLIVLVMWAQMLFFYANAIS